MSPHKPNFADTVYKLRWWIALVWFAAGYFAASAGVFK